MTEHAVVQLKEVLPELGIVLIVDHVMDKNETTGKVKWRLAVIALVARGLEVKESTEMI